METFLLPNNDFYNHDLPSTETHFKLSLLDHLLSKSSSYDHEEDNSNSIYPIDDIETSAFTEHIHSAALPQNPACSIYTASTENSLCANNGSFDTTGLDELFKGLRSGDPEWLLAKPLGTKSLRNPRKRGKGGIKRVMEKAKEIMRKVFGKFLHRKNTKKMMRQQMRRHEESWRWSYKEFEKGVRMIGNRSLRRGFEVCGCREGHGFVCEVVRGLWREFLEQNVEDVVRRLQGISVTMKKILMEMGILLRRSLG